MHQCFSDQAKRPNANMVRKITDATLKMYVNLFNNKKQ